MWHLSQPVILMGESADLHFPFEKAPSQMLGSLPLAEQRGSPVTLFPCPLSIPTSHTQTHRVDWNSFNSAKEGLFTKDLDQNEEIKVGPCSILSWKNTLGFWRSISIRHKREAEIRKMCIHWKREADLFCFYKFFTRNNYIQCLVSRRYHKYFWLKLNFCGSLLFAND